ncbi:MAG: hypothetical protein CSA96_06130, partial [Bacteroidetes bacterium]
MTTNTNNDKGFLREKMQGFQVSPPPSVWEGVSAGLGGAGRGRALIVFLSAAASIALALGLGLWYFSAASGPGSQLALESREAPMGNPGSDSGP